MPPRRPLEDVRGRPSTHQALAPLEPRPRSSRRTEPIYHPQIRGECEGGPRPCPLVGCAHNTYLEVRSNGRIALSHPGREPEDVPPDESCALDVADQGGATLEVVGNILGLTRERIRQIEISVIQKIDIAVARSERECKTP